MTVPTPTYTDGDWGYDLIDVEGTQKAVIVAYLGSQNVTINFPATVGGYAVHRVGKAEPQVDWVNTSESAQTVIPASPTVFTVTGLTFADGIVEIGHSAFAQCKWINGPVTLPETLVTVGSNAFRGCGGERSQTNGINGVLTIPDSVTTIGNYAFRFLTKVHQIVVGTGVTKIGVEVFFQAMMTPSQGQPVKLYFHGPRITNIGTSAFALGQSADKVTCDVYSSGNWALAELPSKTNANTTLRFGDSINEWTFTLDTNDDATITGYTGTSTILDIPSIIGADRPVRYIGANAFQNSNCTKVIVPDSVKRIEERAFTGCSSLAQLVLNEGLVTISEAAFYGTGITTLTLPNTLQSMSDSAFETCTSLQSVTIGTELSRIPNSAFSGCISLTTVNFGNSVNEIGNIAFGGCTLLTNCELPFTLTSIGRSAFQLCTSLTEVTFPVAVTTIGVYAYRSCTSMDTITFRGQPTAFGSGAFALGTSSTSVTATVKSNNNWASSVLDDYKNAYTTLVYDLLGTKYAHLIHENEKIQVDSAIRDEDGVRIKTNYAKGPGRTLGASIPNPADEQTSVIGQALIVNEDGDGFVFGEAGKVDNVVNAAGQSVVDANKIAHLPMGTVQLLNQPAEFVSNTDTSTNEEFPYRASVSVTGVTSSTYAEVTYSEEQATSLNFATFCDTETGVIYLYSRTNVGTVMIPTISIGMDYSDIVIDSAPTSGSGNAISSGAVYTALQDYVTVGTNQNITGSKSFTQSPWVRGDSEKSFNIQNTSITRGTVPSSATRTGSFRITGNSDATLGEVFHVYGSDGSSQLVLNAIKNASSRADLYLTLFQNTDGSGYVTAPFRTSGITTNDVLTAGNGVTLGTVQTISGRKIISNNDLDWHSQLYSHLNIKTLTFDTTYVPVSGDVDTWRYAVFMKDKNDKATGVLGWIRYVSNNLDVALLRNQRTINGSNVNKQIDVRIDANGNGWCEAAYRTSGITSHDILTAGNGVTLGTTQTITGAKSFPSQALRIKTSIPSVTSYNIQWGAGDILFTGQDGSQIGVLRVQQEGTTRSLYVGIFDSGGSIYWTHLASHST